MLLLSHRGRTPEHVENTIEAFDRVLAQGADGIETDVRRSADGRLVLYHDPVLPDGRRVDAVAHAQMGEALGWRVPLLGEALARHPGAYWNVEVKVPDAFADVLVALDACSTRRRPLVSSFWHAALLEHREAYAGPLGLLLGHAPTLTQMRAIVESGADAVVWYCGHTTAELVGFAAESGLRNLAYGCYDRWDLERCAAWGMEAAIVDDVTLRTAP